MKKGFAHLIPIIALAAILLVGTATLNAVKTATTNDSSNVLSSSDGRGNSDKGSKKDSQNSNSGQSDNDNDKNDNQSSSFKSSPNDEIKIESKNNNSRTEIKTGPQKTEIKIKENGNRFETRTQDDKEETKVRIGGLRVEIKFENNRFVTKVKNEDDEEIELEDDEINRILDEAELELEDDGIKIATGSGELNILQNGRRVRTNFPLSINPITGELHVNTPAGEKIVTVLPDTAVQNMIRAGFPIIAAPSPSPEPSASPEATPSASPEATQSASPETEIETENIELTSVNNELAYVISAAKEESLLGLVPVQVKVKGVVSAESGEILEIRHSIFNRILDILSF